MHDHPSRPQGTNLQAIIDAIPTAIFLVRHDTSIVGLNQAAGKLITPHQGPPPEELSVNTASPPCALPKTTTTQTALEATTSILMENSPFSFHGCES